YRPDRGKLLTDQDLAGIERYHRFVDRDGDGIAARTLPGSDRKGAYFVRGSGHNQFGGYTEDADEYQQVVDRLKVKWETARKRVPEALLRKAKSHSEIGVIAFGSSHGATGEAIDQLARDGVHVDYLRLRAFPFGDEVQAFLDSHRSVFVIEQNRDAQLRGLLLLELRVEQAKLVSILHYNGLPVPSDLIYDRINSHLKREAVA
ncbi:MAG: 2-oxoacid:acceptor oxidoreductase subunit alpha, partial [Xanthomonadaceae bacterium]|nr:2-oxoacid:acceptor oxidoreductase subunit alpha [Xanthomonadaceae bacterium]